MTGMIFVQTSQIKNYKDGWMEMYCILDPYTKIVSLHPSKTATKCFKALSLENARVIYGGESGRLIKSERGGKRKLARYA